MNFYEFVLKMLMEHPAWSFWFTLIWCYQFLALVAISNNLSKKWRKE